MKAKPQTEIISTSRGSKNHINSTVASSHALGTPVVRCVDHVSRLRQKESLPPHTPPKRGPQLQQQWNNRLSDVSRCGWQKGRETKQKTIISCFSHFHFYSTISCLLCVWFRCSSLCLRFCLKMGLDIVFAPQRNYRTLIFCVWRVLENWLHICYIDIEFIIRFLWISKWEMYLQLLLVAVHNYAQWNGPKH